MIATHSDDNGTVEFNWQVEINNGVVATNMAINGSSSTFFAKASSGGFNDGQWHHVVMISDHRPASENTRLFIDGVEQTTVSIDTRAANDHAAITGVVSIGARFGTTAPQLVFNGEIDEVAIWNRGLTDTEVLELYRRVGNRVK